MLGESFSIPDWAINSDLIWNTPFVSPLARPDDFFTFEGSSQEQDPAADFLSRLRLSPLEGEAASIVDDILMGNESSNAIYGLAGDDMINSFDVNYVVVGGSGADLLIGGDGDDILLGDASIDVDGLLASLGL